MMRIFIISLLCLFGFTSLQAQFARDSRKLKLNYNTDSKGVINYGSGKPTYRPNSRYDAYAFIDTTNNSLYLYQDTFWYRANTIISNTRPAADSVVSGNTIVEYNDIWYRPSDSTLYAYSQLNAAWQPLFGIYYSNTEPANGSGVEYTNSFWRRNDTTFYYLAGNWEPLVPGVSVNLYNADDTLTGNRVLEGDGKSLTLDSLSKFVVYAKSGSISDYFYLDPDGGSYWQTVTPTDDVGIFFESNNTLSIYGQVSSVSYGYSFPTTSPSSTLSAKNVMLWTGTGSGATPSFVDPATIGDGNGIYSGSGNVPDNTYVTFDGDSEWNWDGYNSYMGFFPNYWNVYVGDGVQSSTIEMSENSIFLESSDGDDLRAGITLDSIVNIFGKNVSGGNYSYYLARESPPAILGDTSFMMWIATGIDGKVNPIFVDKDDLGFSSTWLKPELEAGNVSISSGSNVLSLIDGSDTLLLSGSSIYQNDGTYLSEFRPNYISLDDIEGTEHSMYLDFYQLTNNFNDGTGSYMTKGSANLSGVIGLNDQNGISSSRYNRVGTDSPLKFGIVGASDDGTNSVGGELALRSSRTVSATNYGVTQSGDLLGRITAYGNYDQTSTALSWSGKQFSSKIEFRATETYSNTARGSNIIFSTTDNGTTVVDDRLVIHNSDSLTTYGTNTFYKTAVTGDREQFVKFKVSDATNDMGGIANASYRTGTGTPALWGYSADSTNSPLTFRALIPSVRNASSGDPMFAFQAAITDDLTDPNSGTFSEVNSRPLWALYRSLVGGTGSLVYIIDGSGNTVYKPTLGQETATADFDIQGSLRLRPYGSTPTGNLGEFYVDHTDSIPYYYDGTQWVSLLSSGADGNGIYSGNGSVTGVRTVTLDNGAVVMNENVNSAFRAYFYEDLGGGSYDFGEVAVNRGAAYFGGEDENVRSEIGASKYSTYMTSSSYATNTYDSLTVDTLGVYISGEGSYGYRLPTTSPSPTLNDTTVMVWRGTGSDATPMFINKNLFGGGSTYTFDNGLTETGGNVDLGGTMNADIIITDGTNTHDFALVDISQVSFTNDDQWFFMYPTTSGIDGTYTNSPRTYHYGYTTILDGQGYSYLYTYRTTGVGGDYAFGLDSSGVFFGVDYLNHYYRLANTAPSYTASDTTFMVWIGTGSGATVDWIEKSEIGGGGAADGNGIISALPSANVSISSTNYLEIKNSGDASDYVRMDYNNILLNDSDGSTGNFTYQDLTFDLGNITSVLNNTQLGFSDLVGSGTGTWNSGYTGVSMNLLVASATSEPRIDLQAVSASKYGVLAFTHSDDDDGDQVYNEVNNTENGQVMGVIQWFGTLSGGGTEESARIRAVATQDFGATDNGTEIQFWTTVNTGALTEVLTLEQDRSITAGYYGDGNVTGTLSRLAAFNTDGKFIELLPHGVTPEATETLRTSTYTAVKGEIALINSSAAARTVNPPASPSIGDRFGVSDATASAATYNITIDFDTANQKLYGVEQNYILTANGAYVEFVYVGTTTGWIATK